jgi:hypothetical protein
MKLKRTHGAFMVTGVAAALIALLGTHPIQDDLAVGQPKVDPSVTPAYSSEPRMAKPAPESMPPCDTVSPFAAATVACSQVARSPHTDSAIGDAAPSNEGSVMGAVPDFVKVEVIGSLGGGVAASLLKAAERDLAGTTDNHDAMLIDSSAMPDAAVATTIQQALSRGQYIIVDGSDSIESSTKLNRIMADLNLLSMSGVTAYGISKGTDGKLEITPLQNLPNEKGVRSINQIHNVLGIKKS